MLYRLAQICLMAQIVFAPVLLGGARVWAMGILSILTGIGLVAIVAAQPIKIHRYLRLVWLLAALVSVWMIVQSLPVWPLQSAPFNAHHIALFPSAWQDTVADIVWFAATITLAVLIAQTRPDRFLKQVCITIICAAALQTGLAALAEIKDWQTTFWFPKTAHLGDWTGSFANRNAFAVLMVLGIVASLSCFSQHTQLALGKRLDQKGGWIALAVMFGFATQQSQSRSGVVIAILCIMVFASMQMRARRVWQRVLILLSIAAFGIVFVARAAPEFTARFAELARLDLIQRDDAWASAINAIMARPITGFGPGSIARVMDHFATPGLNTSANWFSSHNVWLDATMTLGLPMTLILLSVAAFAGFKIWRGVNIPNQRALFAASIILFVLSASVGWVITLPALILPLGLLWIGCLEASIVHPREGRAPAYFAARSAPPDQTLPTES